MLKTAFKKFEGIWSALKAVFHKIYLVHSWNFIPYSSMFEKKSLTQFIVVLKCVKKLNPRLYVRKINCNLPTHVKFTCNYIYLYVTLFGTSWKRLNLHFSFSRSILFFDFITYNLLGSRTIAPKENCPLDDCPPDNSPRE